MVSKRRKCRFGDLKRLSHDKQLANILANCWRPKELVSVLANFFTNFFVFVNSYLTCERLANVSCQISTCFPIVVVSFTHGTLCLPTLVCHLKAALAFKFSRKSMHPNPRRSSRQGRSKYAPAVHAGLKGKKNGWNSVH